MMRIPDSRSLAVPRQHDHRRLRVPEPAKSVVRSTGENTHHGVMAFSFIAMLMLSRAVMQLIQDPTLEHLDLEPDLRLQIAWVFLYGAVLLAILPRLPDFVMSLSRSPHIPLIVIASVASVMWSSAPDLTLRRSLALVGGTLVGGYLGYRLELRDLLRVLSAIGLTVALSSLVSALAFPRFGVMPAGRGLAGAWRGVFPHKNALGLFMALALIVFGLRLLEHRRLFSTHTIGLALSSFLIWKAQAVTSWVVTVALLVSAVFLYWIQRGSRDRHLAAFCGVGVATLVVYWVMSRSGLLLGAIEREETFYGRVELWSGVLDVIRDAPLLGHGYGALWYDGGPSREILRGLDWTTNNAHNGFLELALALGSPAVVIFLVGFFGSFASSLKVIGRTTTPVALWPLLYLVFFLIANMTESVLLQQNDLFWALYVATVISKSKLTVATKPGSRPPVRRVTRA